ncbi:energy-coupling factor ABC transporter ATP-binding protein [Janibacter sp. G1551]|uniref:energy-coupling factor ABC transporter ATP-binding protein n=1 Tax=Janibacter sp. G1551 TaxID=3420440 RepID=UPI003CFE2FD7
MTHRLGSWTPPDDADTALALRGVHARYPGASADVLDCVSLTIGLGRRTAVLGANGSGKTTLLRVLSGAHRPAAGTVISGGRPLDHGRRGLTAHRQRVQLVTQDPDDQLFSADVRADVGYGPTNLGLPPEEVVARVDEALDVLSLCDLADRPVHRLSFGQRKRVAVAGALAMRSDVLLLDEPTAGLDPVGVAEMLDAVAALERHGTTVVLSTHDVDLAWRWADEVVVVVDGVVSQGSVRDALGDADLLARARLEQPWPLALLGSLGMEPAQYGWPRTHTDVAAVLARDGVTPVAGEAGRT